MLHPVRLRASHWAGIVTGALVVVLAFSWDFRHILAGEMPHPFHWGTFAVGLCLGMLSYARARTVEAEHRG